MNLFESAAVRLVITFMLMLNYQVSGRGKRSLETKLLKVYVKLLARLLRDSEKDKFGTNDQGSNE